MEHNRTDTNRPRPAPRVVRTAGIGLLVALLAIVYFNVPLSTVVTWSIFIALIFGSHGQQSNPLSGTDNRALAAQPVKADHTDHSRRCH